MKRSEIKDAIMRVQIDAAIMTMEQFLSEYPNITEEHYWGQMKNLDYPMVKTVLFNSLREVAVNPPPVEKTIIEMNKNLFKVQLLKMLFYEKCFETKDSRFYPVMLCTDQCTKQGFFVTC
jgi:hypothetical protein